MANDKHARVMSAAVFLITKHYRQPRERAGSIYIMWSILPETLCCVGEKKSQTPIVSLSRENVRTYILIIGFCIFKSWQDTGEIKTDPELRW